MPSWAALIIIRFSSFFKSSSNDDIFNTHICLHEFLVISATERNSLILLVGPQGLEPWTNGL